MVQPQVPKWDPATKIFLQVTLKTNFSIGTTALILSSIWSLPYLTTVSALLPLPERDSFNLYTLSIPVTHLHSIPGKFLTPLTFLSMFFPKAKVHAPVCTQSLIVFCRRYSSSLPSQDKNSILFSHFPILHRLCGDDTDFLKKREALSKQAITSINKLVDNYVTAGKGRSNIPLTLAFQPITQ